VFGHFAGFNLFFLTLYHDADFFDDAGIGERGDIADIASVGDGGEDAAHDFAGTGLGHVRHDIDEFGTRNFADELFVRFDDAPHDVIARRNAGFERDIDDGDAPFHFIGNRDNGGFGDFGDGETGGFDFFSAETMPCDVDYIVNASENAEIAILRLHRAVARHIGPIVPIFAAVVAVVTAIVGVNV